MAAAALSSLAAATHAIIPSPGMICGTGAADRYRRRKWIGSMHHVEPSTTSTTVHSAGPFLTVVDRLIGSGKSRGTSLCALARGPSICQTR